MAANQRGPTGNANQWLLVARGNRTNDQQNGTDDFVSFIYVIYLALNRLQGKCISCGEGTKMLWLLLLTSKLGKFGGCWWLMTIPHFWGLCRAFLENCVVSRLGSSCGSPNKHLQWIYVGGSSITMLPRLRSKFSDLELLWKVECMQYSKEGAEEEGAICQLVFMIGEDRIQDKWNSSDFIPRQAFGYHSKFCALITTFSR